MNEQTLEERGLYRVEYKARLCVNDPEKAPFLSLSLHEMKGIHEGRFLVGARLFIAVDLEAVKL